MKFHLLNQFWAGLGVHSSLFVGRQSKKPDMFVCHTCIFPFCKFISASSIRVLSYSSSLQLLQYLPPVHTWMWTVLQYLFAKNDKQQLNYKLQIYSSNPQQIYGPRVKTQLRNKENRDREKTFGMLTAVCPGLTLFLWFPLALLSFTAFCFCCFFCPVRDKNLWSRLSSLDIHSSSCPGEENCPVW